MSSTYPPESHIKRERMELMEDDCCPYFHSCFVFSIQGEKGVVGTRWVGANKNWFACRASHKISNRSSQHEFSSKGRQCTLHHILGVTLMWLGSSVLSWWGGTVNTSAVDGWTIKAVRICNFPDFTLISLCVYYHVIAVIFQVEGEDCNNTKSIIFDWCVTKQTSVWLS